MTDEERNRMVCCAPPQPFHGPMGNAVLIGPSPPAAPLSDADVERVARRAAEIVLEAVAGRLAALK